MLQNRMFNETGSIVELLIWGLLISFSADLLRSKGDERHPVNPMR